MSICSHFTDHKTEVREERIDPGAQFKLSTDKSVVQNLPSEAPSSFPVEEMFPSYFLSHHGSHCNLTSVQAKFTLNKIFSVTN